MTFSTLRTPSNLYMSKSQFSKIQQWDQLVVRVRFPIRVDKRENDKKIVASFANAMRQTALSVLMMLLFLCDHIMHLL